jgi:hypothetical protein
MTSTLPTNPLQKINEDNKLRPFLSSLFDAESYIKNVIIEGRSEESFSDIVNGIEEINVKIKEYISLHKVHHLCEQISFFLYYPICSRTI